MAEGAVAESKVNIPAVDATPNMRSSTGIDKPAPRSFALADENENEKKGFCGLPIKCVVS